MLKFFIALVSLMFAQQGFAGEFSKSVVLEWPRRISITSNAGGIQITQAKTPAIEITGANLGQSTTQLKVTFEANDWVKIQVVGPQSNRPLKIAIPARLCLALAVTSGQGDILFSDFDTQVHALKVDSGFAILRSTLGDVTVKNITTGGAIQIEVRSGSIHLWGNRGPNIVAHTRLGWVQATSNALAYLKASSHQGNVLLLENRGIVDAESDFGLVQVKDHIGDVNAFTINGDVILNNPNARSENATAIGGSVIKAQNLKAGCGAQFEEKS